MDDKGVMAGDGDQGGDGDQDGGDMSRIER